ncbi:MAG: hypothetical protein ACI87E_000426 [Mariniblastus sp.]|jgi:hypothetical protein
MARSLERLNRNGNRADRRGVVLYMVVVIVLLLTLIVYGLLISMRAQNLAAAVAGDRLQARQSAFSARDVLLSLVENSRQSRDATGGIELNPNIFSNIQLAAQGSDDDEFLPFGVVLHPDFNSLKFGAVNESGKINLRILLEVDRQFPGTGRTILMRLPDITATIADHLLDWIDADDQRRDLGNESPFYIQNFGYPARNGIPPVLDECLRIAEIAQSSSSNRKSSGRGIQDNRNIPSWMSYLTVSSGERNEAYSGVFRIDLNQPDIFQLHQSLVQNLDLETANFIILFRQFGPATTTSQSKDVRVFSRLATDVAINFSLSGSHEITSLLDVVDQTIEVPQSETERFRIDSPVGEDRSDFAEKLPKILNFCTIIKQETIRGRVNINIAPFEVLLSVPGIDESIAEQIMANQMERPGGRREIAWLLTERIVSLETFRNLIPFITDGGDVYRARFAGFSDPQTAPFVFEAVLDASGKSIKQLELTRLYETFEFRQMLDESTK